MLYRYEIYKDLKIDVVTFQACEASNANDEANNNIACTTSNENGSNGHDLHLHATEPQPQNNAIILPPKPMKLGYLSPYS